MTFGHFITLGILSHLGKMSFGHFDFGHFVILGHFVTLGIMLYNLENRFRISDPSLKTTSMVIYNKRQQQKPRVWYEKSRAQVVIKLGPLEMSF